MKTEYTRPNSIHDALEILNSPNSIPLAGGTYLNTPEAKLELEMRTGGATIALVDLKAWAWTHPKTWKFMKLMRVLLCNNFVRCSYSKT
jgi:hypothetical protein